MSDQLRRGLKLVVMLLIVFSLMWQLPAKAASDVTEVKVSLGNNAGELKFFPDHFELVAGKNINFYWIIPVPLNTISPLKTLLMPVGPKK